jgi:hypothetical protein
LEKLELKNSGIENDEEENEIIIPSENHCNEELIQDGLKFIKFPETAIV